MMNTAATPRQAWLSIIAVSLFFCYEFMQLSLFNAIGEEVRHAFQLNAKQLGNLSSYYFYATALLLIPAGIMLDKFSTKKLVLWGTLLCSVATLVFALTNNYWIAALTRFLVGCGSAFCFISCIRIASRWFPAHHMAMATGVINTIGMMGGMITQMPCVLLNNLIGWRYTVLCDAGLGVFIMLAIWYYVQDYPPDHPQESNDHEAILPKIKVALMKPHNLITGCYASLLNFVVVLLGALWGIKYLTTNHLISSLQASYATMVYFIGMIIGGVLYGYISDHWGHRKLPMIIGPLLSLALILYLMLAEPLPLPMIIVLLGSLGITISSQLLSYPTVVALNPASITATATSIVSFLVVSGAFIIQPFFGFLIHYHHTHHQDNNILVNLYNQIIQYCDADIEFAMWIIPISFVLSAILAIFIPETSGTTNAID